MVDYKTKIKGVPLDAGEAFCMSGRRSVKGNLVHSIVFAKKSPTGSKHEKVKM